MSTRPSDAEGLRVVASLRLGERTVTRSDDGLLGAEYALFDPSDIVLRATDPVTVREAGYMTTAALALERLARAGVTFGLAEAAARALSPEVAASYARAPAARGVVERLGAQEIFDGAIFRARATRYEGAWLDLAALSAQLPMRFGSLLLQALHLAATLEEAPGATPVHMATAAVTRDRRPGERTHMRVDLDGIERMPAALARVRPRLEQTAPDPAHDRRMRRALVARVRERMSAHTSPQLRAHLDGLDAALAPRTMELGPLASPELQAIERQLATGDATGVDVQLDGIELAHGGGAGLRYLRARAALLRGEEPPRSVAALLSEIAQHEAGFHEAVLGAARSWLAAGEEANARYFARQLAEDPSAPDTERLIALEILEGTAPTSLSHAPPAVAHPSPPRGVAPVRIPQFPSLGAPGELPLPPADTRPTAWPAAAPASMPPLPPATPPSERASAPPAPWAPEPWPDASEALPAPPGTRADSAALDGSADEERASSFTHEGRLVSEPDDTWQEVDSVEVLPAAAPPARRGSASTHRARYEPELVESLSLPFGASEGDLGMTELPRTPMQARVAMTRLARLLARDYRLWYGKALRCNVLAIDAMQQHLIHRFTGAPIADEGVAWELRRHGALLSEILARVLGAAWTDIGPSEPGYWAMVVPPGIRAWPIGRAYRFVALGHRERDLVGYYLELESRVRSLGG